jgi:hypothetical protein
MGRGDQKMVKRFCSMLVVSLFMVSLLSACSQNNSAPTNLPSNEPIPSIQVGTNPDHTIETTEPPVPSQVIESTLGLYDQSTLQYWQTRYPVSTQRIYEIGMLPILLPEEKEALADVEFRFPLAGEYGYQNDPFAFYSTPDPPTVIMPIQSLKFLDDLTIAYAWLWANGYSLETVTDYVAMLKYQKDELFEGRHPAPLVALQIPDDALEDSEVDELALRFFNSARAFILAHELGHIYHHHTGNKNVTTGQSQINEEEADLFALDIIGRTSTIPMGAYLYFLFLVHWEPNKGDFQSDMEWQAHLAESTHPFTAHRMDEIAMHLAKSANDFTRNETDPTIALETIGFIANGMSEVADMLEDPEIQISMAFKGRATDVAFLAPRRPGALPCEYSQGLSSAQAASSTFHGIYIGEYIRNLADWSAEELPMCMILNRRNEKVTGLFSFGLGEGYIIGRVVDDNLIFEWQWGKTYGKGMFQSTQQGREFSGVWGYNESRDDGGEWRGHKQ